MMDRYDGHDFKGFYKVRYGGVLDIYQWWRTMNPSPIRPTSQCRVCNGSGMNDAHNECGYCY